MYRDDKKYKCVIFDLDGTLLDSASAIADSVIASAKLNSLPIPSKQKAKDGVGKSFDSQYMNLFVNGYTEEQVRYSYEMKDKFRADFRKIYAEQNVAMFPYAEELLDYLTKQGYELAISTNGPRSMLKRVLAHFGLSELFAVTCCGDEYIAKPDPEMLTHIILELGFKNSDAVMVGDSVADMCAAENAGMDAILFAGDDLAEIKKACTPNFVIESLQDVIKLV